jgi:hypothetical protein
VDWENVYFHWSVIQHNVQFATVRSQLKHFNNEALIGRHQRHRAGKANVIIDRTRSGKGMSGGLSVAYRKWIGRIYLHRVCGWINSNMVVAGKLAHGHSRCPINADIPRSALLSTNRWRIHHVYILRLIVDALPAVPPTLDAALRP